MDLGLPPDWLASAGSYEQLADQFERKATLIQSKSWATRWRNQANRLRAEARQRREQFAVATLHEAEATAAAAWQTSEDADMTRLAEQILARILALPGPQRDAYLDLLDATAGRGILIPTLAALQAVQALPHDVQRALCELIRTQS